MAGKFTMAPAQVALLRVAEPDMVSAAAASLGVLVAGDAHAKHALVAAGGLDALVAALLRGASAATPAAAAAAAGLQAVVSATEAASLQRVAAYGAPATTAVTSAVRRALGASPRATAVAAAVAAACEAAAAPLRRAVGRPTPPQAGATAAATSPSFAAAQQRSTLRDMEGTASVYRERRMRVEEAAFRPVQTALLRQQCSCKRLARAQREAARALFSACAGSLECRGAACTLLDTLYRIVDAPADDAGAGLAAGSSRALISAGRRNSNREEPLMVPAVSFG
jgi:hypothetical protein